VKLANQAQEALEHWRKYGDALPWAHYLADLRRELDDPNGWTMPYHHIAGSELFRAGFTTQDLFELARESRPLLKGLLGNKPWPVEPMWWHDQSRQGKREGAGWVAMHLAVGADHERPNGIRMVATALAMVQVGHEVNTVWYTDHDVPMDAAAITGTHEIRDLLNKLASIAASDADLSSQLLRSAGEEVKIPDNVLEENLQLRRELRELHARLDSVQVQLLEVLNASGRVVSDAADGQGHPELGDDDPDWSE
jgi:hypothetical protein